MIRPRTALTVTAIAAVTAAGGVAVAGAVDRPGDPAPTPAASAPIAAAPAVSGSAALPRAARTGDDGLTHAQASKARAAALRAVPGRATSIDRDADGGPVTYDVTVITRANRAREVHLSSRFRVLRTTAEDRDGLTYAAAGRASSAAGRAVRGVVTGIEVEDEGRARYEVEVLTSRSTERVVRLSSSFSVVTGSAGDDDGDD
ncbi:PepSY domain-containing protein [Patulibacter minatonensis]|uniref:PepSY domain-containing protein n=1 Tax=Patulibacter minatonensis TaxID=298163 RepID=UPI0012FC5002|nr:PepSY domain-containing protein [Patulibacter minatonensis]